MANNIKTILHIFSLLQEQHKPAPIMLRGRHGIGKTALFEELANSLGYPYIDVYGSQLTEGDLLGIPKTEMYKDTDTKVTKFAFPEWLVKAQHEPCVLVFEEIDRADPQVRKSFMQLACGRRLMNLELHPNTIIGAAINGGPSGQEYQVGQMDPAELDRWTVFDFEPTIKEWLEWGKQPRKEGEEATNLHPYIIKFFEEGNKGHLEHKEAFEPDKIYPSRRSWHRLSELLETSNLLVNEEVAKKNAFVIEKIAAGMIGVEASIPFKSFLQTLRVIQIEDIMKEGLDVYSDTLTSMEILSIFKRGLEGSFFEEYLTKNKANSKAWKKACSNIAAFADEIPREAFAKVQAMFLSHLQHANKFNHYSVLMRTKVEKEGETYTFADIANRLFSTEKSDDEE